MATMRLAALLFFACCGTAFGQAIHTIQLSFVPPAPAARQPFSILVSGTATCFDGAPTSMSLNGSVLDVRHDEPPPELDVVCAQVILPFSFAVSVGGLGAGTYTVRYLFNDTVWATASLTVSASSAANPSSIPALDRLALILTSAALLALGARRLRRTRS